MTVSEEMKELQNEKMCAQEKVSEKGGEGGRERERKRKREKEEAREQEKENKRERRERERETEGERQSHRQTGREKEKERQRKTAGNLFQEFPVLMASLARGSLVFCFLSHQLLLHVSNHLLQSSNLLHRIARGCVPHFSTVLQKLCFQFLLLLQ